MKYYYYNLKYFTLRALCWSVPHLTKLYILISPAYLIAYLLHKCRAFALKLMLIDGVDQIFKFCVCQAFSIIFTMISSSPWSFLSIKPFIWVKYLCSAKESILILNFAILFFLDTIKGSDNKKLAVGFPVFGIYYFT